MGCGQGKIEVVQAAEPARANAFDSLNSKQMSIKSLADSDKCVIQIGDRSEVEVEAPAAHRDYDSWKHQVDETDLSALRRGHALPMNREAHFMLQNKIIASLSAIERDPAQLKRAIKLRRMDKEEIAAYARVAALNGPENITESKAEQKKKMQPAVL
ncbi:unnamed protein product [Effrenium voratum]|nr:unnamed protein product [Effrenium voratum]CAJ1435841.1 unnamed protein product [Effrenium voratum]